MNNSNQSQSSLGRILLPHQKFDIVTKDVFYTFPEEVLRFIMNRTDIQFLEHLESEFITVEKREMDSLVKVLLNDRLVLVHCEFQTGDSSDVDMTRRNIGYMGRCYEKYGLPILSHVIYLKPNSGKNDPGGYIQDIEGYNFIVEYKVIRLIDIDGQSVLESRQPGLMPFASLMKPPSGMTQLQWINECIETIKSIQIDSSTRANLLVDLWVMSGLTHERESLTHLISEEIMQESSVYQYIIEKGKVQGIEQGIEQGRAQGIEQGERNNTIESILELLSIRLHIDITEAIKSNIESIDSLQRLKQLRRAAAQVQNVDDFMHILQNGSDLD